MFFICKEYYHKVMLIETPTLMTSTILIPAWKLISFLKPTSPLKIYSDRTQISFMASVVFDVHLLYLFSLYHIYLFHSLQPNGPKRSHGIIFIFCETFTNSHWAHLASVLFVHVLSVDGIIVCIALNRWWRMKTSFVEFVHT